MPDRPRQTEYEPRQGQRVRYEPEQDRFDTESGARYRGAGDREEYGFEDWQPRRWDQESGYQPGGRTQQLGRGGWGERDQALNRGSEERRYGEQRSGGRDYDTRFAQRDYGGSGYGQQQQQREYGGGGQFRGGQSSGWREQLDRSGRGFGPAEQDRRMGETGEPYGERGRAQGNGGRFGSSSQGMAQSGMEADLGPYSGRGPRGYQRSDDRIREEVCEALTRHGGVDATEINVSVHNGDVTLSGNVDDRRQKRMAEDCIETLSGVKDVNNQLRVGGMPDRGGQSNGQQQPGGIQQPAQQSE